jgi:Cytochrome c7 and related cytochrome c
VLKFALVGSLVASAVLGAFVVRAVARAGIHQGYSPAQPIEFSHRLHAGESHIPCLYCHYAAARSQHAGIPAASVCMNCHGLLTRETAELEKLRESVLQRRPIHWMKVHNLPDFVHFDHSQHVLASVACQACHGPVERMVRVQQQMPLTMGWCLGCHEARGVGDHGERTDCVRCHY